MLDHMFDPRDLSPERVRPLSRVEYDKLVGLGMFDDERVELLRGALVTMSPQGERHSLISQWIAEQLTLALHASFKVFSHSPFAASDDSEPEPDIQVAPRANTFAHPSSSLLLVEISDSSLRKDRRLKAPIYAEAGVPEYWIVDVSGDELVIEVHTDPTPTGYRRVELFRDGDVLKPIELPAIAIAVRDIPWPR